MSRLPTGGLSPAGRQLRAAGRLAVGDRYGLVLWLGLLCWFGLTWRVGIFIQDTYALANALVALSNGQLQVTQLPYSLTLGSQPGLHEYGGRLYGRNYGQLALAVPLVWAFEALATVADPRLLLAALWAGLGLAFVTQVGRLAGLDREHTAAVGSVTVAALFVGSLLTATDLPADRLPLAALQLSTMLAAATAGLLCYRLVALVHGRRLGLASGAALGLATPVGFWATIPKRHTVVAALVLGAVYAFAVSRTASGRRALRARVAAYAIAVSITWVHAFEAFFVVVALAAVDLPTARSNRPRELLAVGLAGVAAATPMLATNYAISGNPARPPRLLPQADGGDAELAPGAGGGGAGGGSGASGSGGGTAAGGGGSDPSLVESLLEATGPVGEFAGEAVVEGLAVLSRPGRLVDIFVRSGNVRRVQYAVNDYEVVELALLEAAPLLAALSALAVLALGRTASGRPWPRPRELSPRRQTDLLVTALAVVLTVVYLSRLPLFSQLTVRYLHPVVGLALYGVCRVPAVRAAVGGATRWLLGATAASLALALTVVLAGVVGLDLALGEAVQYHALWNLAAAVACAGTVLGHTVAPERVPVRAVAAGLALPAGFTTAYLTLSGLVYFEYGTYAFDLVGALADLLPTL